MNYPTKKRFPSEHLYEEVLNSSQMQTLDVRIKIKENILRCEDDFGENENVEFKIEEDHKIVTTLSDNSNTSISNNNVSSIDGEVIEEPTPDYQTKLFSRTRKITKKCLSRISSLSFF